LRRKAKEQTVREFEWEGEKYEFDAVAKAESA
jgi:hypothetical protein